jgi:amino acid transporter
MESTLRRSLGVRELTATSTGLAFPALQYLVVASLVGYLAGDAAWMAIGVATVLILLVRGFFAELNGLFPSAAGIRLWMRRAMDDRAALSIGLSYLTTVVLVIAADAYIIGSAIAYTLGHASWVVALYIAAVLGAATWANLRGVNVAGRVQDVATALVIAITIGVVTVALARHGLELSGPIRALSEGSPADFLQAVVLGVFLFGAFEWVTTNAEEARDPNLIPRAMTISIAILFVTGSLLATSIGQLLSERELDTAYPQLFLGQGAGGRSGLLVMMGVTALTAVNTFNGGLVTASRFLYATAREGSLPGLLARLNSRAVPWAAVVGLAASSLAASLLVALTGSWQVMIAVGAALEAGIYAIAGFCVFQLRRRMPDAPRPSRAFGGGPAILATSVVFALLAVGASTTVDGEINLLPLGIVVGVASLVTFYVLAFVPRMRAAQAARVAAAAERRRAGRIERRERH